MSDTEMAFTAQGKENSISFCDGAVDAAQKHPGNGIAHDLGVIIRATRS